MLLDGCVRDSACALTRAIGHDGGVQGAIHETSQTFVRPLSFGRKRCFRLHRFKLLSARGLKLTSALSEHALQRAAVAAAARDSAPLAAKALRGENLCVCVRLCAFVCVG